MGALREKKRTKAAYFEAAVNLVDEVLLFRRRSMTPRVPSDKGAEATRKTSGCRGLYHLLGTLYVRSSLQPVGFSLGEDATKLVLTHRNKSFSTSHQVRHLQMIGGAARPGWNVKDDYPTVWVHHVINIHSESDRRKSFSAMPTGLLQPIVPTTGCGGWSATPSSR